jgi:hypothetical protein
MRAWLEPAIDLGIDCTFGSKRHVLRLNIWRCQVVRVLLRRRCVAIMMPRRLHTSLAKVRVALEITYSMAILPKGSSGCFAWRLEVIPCP